MWWGWSRNGQVQGPKSKVQSPVDSELSTASPELLTCTISDREADASRSPRMNLTDACRRVELILSDVDGVLTDGGIWYDNQGVELKAFHIRDGLGIKLWQRAGFRFGVLTARTSHIVKLRAGELGIDIVRQGFEDKLPAAQEIIRDCRLTPEQVCYIGDDLTDLPVIRSSAWARRWPTRPRRSGRPRRCVTATAGRPRGGARADRDDSQGQGPMGRCDPAIHDLSHLSLVIRHLCVIHVYRYFRALTVLLVLARTYAVAVVPWFEPPPIVRLPSQGTGFVPQPARTSNPRGAGLLSAGPLGSQEPHDVRDPAVHAADPEI